MEVAAIANIPIFSFSKTIKFNKKPYFFRRIHLCLPPCRSMSVGSATAFGSNIDHRRYRELILFSYVGNLLRNAFSLAPESGGLARLSSLSFSSTAGGGGGGVKGGRGLGGGGGGGSGGEGRGKSLAVEAEEGPSAGPDVILLDVGGMSCGGCAASVKRILESQPQVSSATVNLATETAVVWAVPEGEVMHNWQKRLGVKLASQLTTYGFKSNIRDSARESWYRVFERKMDEKLQLLKQSGKLLLVLAFEGSISQ